MNESSNVLAITALRDNLGRKGADTPAAPFFRHKPRDKRAVALRVVGLRNRYGRIVRIRLTKEQPPSTWNLASPSEYPRSSQTKALRTQSNQSYITR
jgi:hypothetical protein